ncbi:MAG: peptidyl-prolyl cis-trans isomerase A (cyclophilin A) [Alteromonadaceae bacterium]|jgi:peptidyl-prolyl cis-trans isomerase A (cyclophilin A)
MNKIFKRFLRSSSAWLALLLIILCPSLHAEIKGEYIQPDNLYPKVKMETSLGDIIIELDRGRARLTVDNFLAYAAEGQYDKTIFHRIEKDFVVQGGGYTKEFEELSTKKPIFNESGSGLKNTEGTIAMATEARLPHSATRQFFFNVIDNPSLDPGRRWGYAVFGSIIEGSEVLEAMAAVEVDFNEKLGWSTVPKKMLILKRVTIIEPEPLPVKSN